MFTFHVNIGASDSSNVQELIYGDFLSLFQDIQVFSLVFIVNRIIFIVFIKS